MSPVPNKTQIIQRLQTERRRLEKNLGDLSHEEMLLPGVVGVWSVKDVLAHLADWLARMPVWVETSRRGDPVACPGPGFTWKDVHLLNQQIYENHRTQSLDEVMHYFHASFDHLLAMVEAMPEEEMMIPGLYPFLGKGRIYDWLNAYAAHDMWAKRKIRHWLKERHQQLVVVA